MRPCQANECRYKPFAWALGSGSDCTWKRRSGNRSQWLSRTGERHSDSLYWFLLGDCDPPICAHPIPGGRGILWDHLFATMKMSTSSTRVKVHQFLFIIRSPMVASDSKSSLKVSKKASKPNFRVDIKVVLPQVHPRHLCFKHTCEEYRNRQNNRKTNKR